MVSMDLKHALIQLDPAKIYPADLTIYEAFMDIIPILALISAAAYYFVVSSNTIRNRKAQLFMNLYQQFSSSEFMKPWSEIFFEWKWEDFDDYLNRYGPSSNLDAFEKYCTVAAYFEGIGVLVKQRLIDIDIVDDLLHAPPIWMWDKTEEITLGYREMFEAPELWEWWEYLYERLKGRETAN